MRRLKIMFVLAVVVAGVVASACQPPPSLGTVSRHQAASPQWGRGGDPHVMAYGGRMYVYSSNSQHRLPVTTVTNIKPVSNADWMAATVEGMPKRPAWAVDNVLWAPTVARFGDRFVLFFAANKKNPRTNNNAQCIGRATAKRPTGPFVAEPKPFSCGLDGWRGALDPSLFVTPDGQNILYAAFSDTEVPIHAIMLKPDGNAQIRRADGQADYWPYAIHGKRHGWEGRFIENPSMIYDPSTKTYLLAYSAGDWWSSSYSTGLARCTTPLGFCSSNSSGPWLASGRGRTGPGGLSFFTVGKSRLAVYASFAKGQEGTGQARHFTVAPVTLGWAPRLG